MPRRKKIKPSQADKPRLGGQSLFNTLLESAAKQVREKRHVDGLRAAGVACVYEYALAFDEKKVYVEHVDDVLKKAQAKAKRARGRKGTAKKAARKR